MDSDTRGLVTNLGWGVSLLVIVSLIFDLMRYFFPKNYYYREQANKLEQWNDYDGTPLYAPERPAWYPFAWLKNVLMYSEEDMVRTHGLDAAMYIRFLRMHGLLFAILALYNLIVLLPLYGTASNKSLAKTSDFFVTGVEIFSLSNVPAKDGRLWGTLISELVVLALVYLTVFRELAVYTKYRLEYRANSTRNPSNYAVIVLDIPPESRTPELIRRFFVRCFPGDVAFVHQIRDAENLFNAKSRIRSAMAAREGAQFKLLAAAAEDPDADLSKLEERLTDALQNQRVAEQGLDDMNDDLDKWAPVTHGAIIVFHSKRAATLACCTPLWNRSNEWVIDRAAEPRAVNWNRLEITNHTSMARSLITMGVLFAFCASWFFVIAGLQGLSNIKELSRTPAFKFLAPMANSQNPSTVATVQFVQGVLPPLLLFILLQLVPMLFRFVIGFERITSLGHFEAKIRSFLFLFYTMSNFVFVVTTGSILKDIQKIVDNPNQLFDFLATAVPAQATFLMKYVLISSFLGSAMGLLNIGRLLIRPLLMWKAKTTRQKRNATAIFSDFPLFKMYALASMVSLISIIFSTISPLICVVAIAYFAIAYLCTKHTVMYSHRGFFESGGELYPGAWYQLLIALYMHQGVLVGIFSLKRAPAQATIAFLLLSVTVAYTVYCLHRFYKISHNGSLMDQLDADDRAGLIDRIPPHFPELYIHPGLSPLEEAEDLTGLPPALREKSEDKKTKKSKQSASRKANGAQPTVETDSTLGISSL